MVKQVSKPLINRRHVRMIAVQTLYQLIAPPPYLTKEAALAYAIENGNDPDEGYNCVKDDYLYTLVDGVLAHREELDQILSAYLDNWRIDRLQRIDLTILRLALYEMNYVSEEEVPNVVAVDEAIDLARGFSDDKSRLFVSGVLMKILNEGQIS